MGEPWTETPKNKTMELLKGERKTAEKISGKGGGVNNMKEKKPMPL